MLVVKGTVGISGGREVGDGYCVGVNKGLFYYCLKRFDRVGLLVDSGY